MTHSIQRINFVERQPLVLTYRHLIFIGGVVVMLLAGYYGLRFVQLLWTESRIAVVRVDVTHLKVEQEMRAKKENSQAAGSMVGLRGALLQELEKVPSWSSVLRDLTTRTPNALWLTRMQSLTKKEEKAEKDPKGQKDQKEAVKQKEEKEPDRQLSMEGMADEPNAIAQFVRALSSSSRFRDVVLKNSQQEKDTRGIRYSFGIELKVVPLGRKL